MGVNVYLKKLLVLTNGYLSRVVLALGYMYKTMNLIGPEYAKCRLAVEAWGLKNCTEKEEWHSDTVTAVVVPSYIDSAEIVRRAWKRYNLSLGLGLNKVAGKVFRIGHLGYLNEVMLISKFVEK